MLLLAYAYINIYIFFFHILLQMYALFSRSIPTLSRDSRHFIYIGKSVYAFTNICIYCAMQLVICTSFYLQA